VPDLNFIMDTLLANKDKSFVDRIINRRKYPVLDLGNGQYATHKMAWNESDGKYHVFPTVLYDGKELRQFSPDEAYNHAKSTGNFIEFNTPEEADYFSKRYKAFWGE
jgi:hypothetical protein